MIVLVVPRSDTPIDRDVDYAADRRSRRRLAIDEPLAVPDAARRAGARTRAELRTSTTDDVTSW